jgi:hypothetical protein
VEREAAPECAQGGVACGAVFRNIVEQLVEGLLAQRAGYIWHTNTFVSIGTTGAIIAWSM